jgi:tetratricopeptide (TPR) repeat protein
MTLRIPTTLLLLFVLLPAAAMAQQPRLLRDAPPPGWRGCVPLAEAPRPSIPQRQEAERLAASATQASILGDTRTALDLLVRAAQVDPASSDIAYHLARAYEEQQRIPDAVEAYCRYTQLAPDAPDAADVSERIATLAATSGMAAALTPDAIAAFEAGIAHHDAGRLAEAEAAFTQARTAGPGWPAPVYNRAVVRLALGRRDAAVSDLREYLQLGAGAAHATEVVDLLATLPGGMRPPHNATGALVAGLIVPGLGHLTTGRTTTGALILGGAVASLAAGLAVERVRVDCLAPPVDGRCPADLVVNERSERPYLLPAVAIAAAVGLYGAWDAWRGAERLNAEAAARLQTGAVDAGAGPRLAQPVLAIGPAGASLELIRIRF